MKTQLIFARSTSGCAALYVNHAVIMEAVTRMEVSQLEDAARKLSAVLKAPLIECELEAPADSHGNWSKVSWGDLVSQLPAIQAQLDSIPVRVWDAYEVEEGVTRVDSHSFEISDQRQSSGQARLIVTAQTASPEPDLLDVLLEVQANPFNAAEHVPAALVHVDMDDPVVSILKLGDKLLMRPNTGVRIQQDVMVIDGKFEDVVLFG